MPSSPTSKLTALGCLSVLAAGCSVGPIEGSPDPSADTGPLADASDVGAPGDATDATPDGEGDSTVPPPDAPAFTCTPAAATSPVLGATFLFDPAVPHPGDTLTVLVKHLGTYTQTTAPKMDLEATAAAGTTTHATTITSGVLGAKGLIYFYEVPNVQLGDLCLLTKIAGAPELAGKITVMPRPAPPSTPPGVYKVVTNHQFTCSEQVPWGNELHVEVRDDKGAGVPGAVVTVGFPATTDTANIKNNAPPHVLPKTLTMDGSGRYDDYFWWPSNTNGFFVMDLSVADRASDVATEVTSGWWETDAKGCRYCDPSQPINVYGHWSHRIVFQLDPKAVDACVVGSDHAGQSSCGASHIYHDPSYTSCWKAH